MNKKIKYLIFVVVIIVLAGLAYLIVSAGLAYLIVKNNQDKTAQDNTSKTVTLTPEQQAAIQQPTSTAPVYTKEVKVEFMADAEKLKMQIPAALKIQVLERNSDGKVTAYKIIRQDSDIMTKYGN